MSETTMTTPGNAGWIGHSSPDSGRAQAFYTDVIGWTITEVPMQDGSSHPCIMVNEAPIGGFSKMPEDTGAWTVFFTVEDVDARCAAATKAGAQLLTGPVDMPGVGRMATLTDPQGARFAMITYESMQS
ncbi:MAG: VOC family protein [Pseudomonadota bacterium]